MPSYWFFFGSPQKKQKHDPCAILLDLFFSGCTKKTKTQPLCPPIGFAFWALLLDLLFWKPQKQKTQPLCPPIGFVFLKAPKKQKHNPCALLLDLFFLKAPKKQKHNPCVLLLDLLFGLSYWICFFGSPKKAKTQPLCPPVGFVFSESTKKAKTQPLCPSIGFAFLAAPKKQKQNPCALLLHLFFLEAPKKQKKLVPSYWMCFFESHKKEKAQPLCKAQTQPLCSRVGFVFLAA